MQYLGLAAEEITNTEKEGEKTYEHFADRSLTFEEDKEIFCLIYVHIIVWRVKNATFKFLFLILEWL